MSSIVLDEAKVSSSVLPNLKNIKNTLAEVAKLGNSVGKYASDSPVSSRSNTNAAAVRSIASDLTKRLGTIGSNVNNVSVKLDAKLEKAKAIEKKNKSKISGIAAAVGAVVGGAAGAVTAGATGAAVGGAIGAAAAVVTSKVVTSVGKALKNTCATVAKSVGNFFSNVWSGIKVIGEAIVNACKKIAQKVVSFVKEKIAPIVKNIGNAILKGIVTIGKAIAKTAATIVNLAVSLVEGLVSFVEAIGDVVLLVVGAACSIVTAVADVIRGVCTGEWDWKCTSAVWKKWIMPWVGYDWTSKVFDGVEKINVFDKWAWEWGKRKGGEGTVCKITKGVGYYTGMLIAATLTAGAASSVSAAAAAAGHATTATVLNVVANTAGVAQGLAVGIASVGKNSQDNYNTTINKTVTDHYVSHLMQEYPELTLEEAEAIVGENIKNGKYNDYNEVRKSAMDNISGADITKGNLKAVGSGVIDGTIFFLAGNQGANIGDKIGTLANNVSSKAGKFLINSFANETSGKGIIKASQAFISEAYNSYLFDGDGKYDMYSALSNAASILTAEKMGGLVESSMDKVSVLKAITDKAGHIIENAFNHIPGVSGVVGKLAEDSTGAAVLEVSESVGGAVSEIFT